MNNLTLRVRLTLLTGCIFVVVTILLTLLSIYSAEEKIVQPITSSLLNQENSLHKEIMDEASVETKLDHGISSYIEVTDVRKAKEKFINQSIIWMVIIILAGIMIIYVVAGKALKPVNDLSRKIGNISEHNLSQRIEHISTKDEMGDLTASFNHMLDRLEESFLYQKSFAANAAHELRTPLTTMMAGIQVLKLEKSPTVEDYKETLEVTEESTQRLIQVVNDLLALAYEQTEHFTDEIELRTMIDTITQDLHPLCLEKNLTISVDIDVETIKGNQTLLYRVFYNLIENAIKYNHENGIIEVQGHVKNSATHISIADSGIGIPKDQLHYIFEPFYRIDHSRARELGGSGLGLSIVRTIVEKHQGKINVSSTLNVGTIFEVILPM
ncbi:ATP-binding protein [Lysinibacillus fusiformis]|uniref:sensor histidine kinase n=1 Tax=Lysinibacillus fusiformis TaxID=28031 RepID=UPI0000F372BF|nr:ATP-binding protein [Lysinibacillus fusiformis]EAZ86769.1 heavy metal sensor signal transduction histidine kinase [Bacillus sp. B14905]MED4075531.1 ATP-binding protein [Lysinibacillus fusiformis]PCD81026.1 two-component sensor histidine kinase [Lysinibacillus fusiformis]